MLAYMIAAAAFGAAVIVVAYRCTPEFAKITMIQRTIDAGTMWMILRERARDSTDPGWSIELEDLYFMLVSLDILREKEQALQERIGAEVYDQLFKDGG